MRLKLQPSNDNDKVGCTPIVSCYSFLYPLRINKKATILILCRTTLKTINMKAKKLIPVMIASTLFLSGCASMQSSSSKDPFTSGQVSLTLHKGKTTEADVLKAFGSPNIVTQDASGNAVWTYQKNAMIESSHSESASALGAFTTIILGGGASASASGSEQSSKTMTLIITFDSKGVLSNFKSMTTHF